MAIATESGHVLTLHDVSNYTRYTIGSDWDNCMTHHADDLDMYFD